MEADLVILVHRMRQGDGAAREQLVSNVYERLLKLCRKMLRSSSSAVQRWEQTDDLAHSAWFRIQRALEDESVSLADDTHFFRLAARHVRFELIDIYRKHSGVQGLAANHQTASGATSRDESPSEGERFAANSTCDPKRLAAWGEFHQVVEDLPEAQKTVVDLLWYQGLKQQDAAEILGVDVKTIKRRWRDAKIFLSERLDSGLVDL